MATALAEYGVAEQIADLQELQARRAARRNLLPFCQFTMPAYEVNWHHEELANALERIEQGALKRLMVFMPPRHGKTLLSSDMFPCWALGRNPRLNIVQTGYSHEITVLHSRHARDRFVSPEFRALFPAIHHVPARLGQEAVPVLKQTAHEWGTRQGGNYYAVGVGGGLTGRGMDIGIIDDPHKNREEAESETMRNKIIDWYRSTFYTRLTPDGAIIVIMTRWHEEDLAGVLLADMKAGGEQWEVIDLPATNERGEALWPSHYGLEELARIKLAIGEHEYAALYDQQPTRRGGNLFKMDRVQWHDNPSEFPDTRYVRFWDLASTEKELAKRDPDWTMGVSYGTTVIQGLVHGWLKDVEAVQAEAPERDRIMRQTAKRDGAAVEIGVEAVGGYKDAATTLKAILWGLRKVTPVPVSKDKVVRAAPLEPIIEAGNFHVLRGAHSDLWYQQMKGFPKGATHDDAVDATSGAHNMVYATAAKAPQRVLLNTVKAFPNPLGSRW